MRNERLYAPAAPFTQAIRDWVRDYQTRQKANPYHAITCQDRPSRPRRGGPAIYPGLELLAQDAGTTSRALRRYLDDEIVWIGLEQADRLAMALGIPLCLLADDFKPTRDTIARTRNERRAERTAA